MCSMVSEDGTLITSYEMHRGIRDTMNGFLGKTFTEEMMSTLRMDIADLILAAYGEGQSEAIPYICANQGMSPCPQSKGKLPASEYDSTVCRKCTMGGGFIF